MHLDHPYQNLPPASQWLRGNFHAHTNRTDGALSPQELIDAFAERGYDFLSISDHDMLTAAEDYAQWNDRGLVLIPGNEITAHGPHFLHIGAEKRIDPVPDRQEVIDLATRSGGFIVVNHPRWRENFDHCPQALLEKWRGYKGIEIFNTTIGRLRGSSYGLDLWDRLLSQGRRIWGFANDDSHQPVDDIGFGWSMVGTAERSPEAIVAAVEAGQFYASTGVVINRIEAEGNRILIETENADRIVASREHQVRFAVADANLIEVEVPEEAAYVRFECWGRGEQFAWTQPFFVRA